MKRRNIIVATYATKRYAYALPNVIRRMAGSLLKIKKANIKIIFVCDQSEQIGSEIKKLCKMFLPQKYEIEICALPLKDDELKNYKEEAQLLIAQMQSHAFSKARLEEPDYFWSIESDVLVPHNALSVSLDILTFDDGYYDVAMCTYPSQGGGSFLGGRGTYRRPIEEDFIAEEREVAKELLQEIENREKESAVKGFEPSAEWMNRGVEIDKIIKESPPKGNVFEANAKQWRQRGWLEFAYPAIGKGAIMPTDWVGFGCTLMSRKALDLAHFDGYDGKGTQDLFIGWNHWKANGINMCVTTHAVCDHIIRQRKGEDQMWENFVHVMAYHEPEGECKGHLRQKYLPFYTHMAGEKPIYMPISEVNAVNLDNINKESQKDS